MELNMQTQIGKQLKPRRYTHKDGTISYRLNGKYHRIDGPAFMAADGTQEWHINGLYHREDGPAIIYADGSQFWYLNGKCHREDGPAVMRTGGILVWYLNGTEYTFRDHCKELKLTDEEIILLKLKYNTCKDI